jgi:septation ring formation regulator EzrA
MRGQIVNRQINVAGSYIEVHDEANVIGDHSSSKVSKNNTFASLDPEVKRALAEIQRNLKPIDQRETQDLLDAVHQLPDNDAAALSDLRGMVDAIRRGLINLQARDLPAMNQNLRQAIEEVQKTLKDVTDVSISLELTIPVVPLLLEYKTHFDLDLGEWWENIKKKLRAG